MVPRGAPRRRRRSASSKGSSSRTRRIGGRVTRRSSCRTAGRRRSSPSTPDSSASRSRSAECRTACPGGGRRRPTLLHDQPITAVSRRYLQPEHTERAWAVTLIGRLIPWPRPSAAASVESRRRTGRRGMDVGLDPDDRPFRRQRCKDDLRAARRGRADPGVWPTPRPLSESFAVPSPYDSPGKSVVSRSEAAITIRSSGPVGREQPTAQGRVLRSGRRGGLEPGNAEPAHTGLASRHRGGFGALEGADIPGASDRSAVARPQRAQHRRKDRVKLGGVDAEVVMTVDRHELGTRDLFCGASSLIEEVHIVRRHTDETSQVPLSEVAADSSLAHRGTPRRPHRGGVTTEVRGSHGIGVASRRWPRMPRRALRCPAPLKPPRRHRPRG